ncbi:hypothetical protein QVD17_38521 [Tagetes erecta]|uniref:Uncharacterized protein n=1 Tax=Tagetes erecta TaxID=13708 RepID=A0AAD8JLZ2_TARER|nr:hypothetical protein QVD17_38521 [Tagetes erecta]
MEIESPSSNFTQVNNSVTNYDAKNDDDLAVSIIKLYSANKSFQTELHKLKDVGKSDHESGETISIQNEDMKTETEELMKQKMEIDVQCVAISKAIEYFMVQVDLMMEHKKIVLEQIEMMKKVEDAEMKAIGLKMQAEQLKVICEEILLKEQVWMF